jgi:hypothetical protein
MTWLPVLVGFLDMIVAVLLIIVARRLLKLSTLLYNRAMAKPEELGPVDMMKRAAEYDRRYRDD